MGSEEPMFPDSGPVHRVQLGGFWIDRALLTSEQFEKVVISTHYVTVAEKKPQIEDFPGADPAKLVAGSRVFTPPDHAVPLNDSYTWWNYVEGANWRRAEAARSKGSRSIP